MRRARASAVAIALLGAAAGCAGEDAPAARVLAFSRTTGYRHDSIADGQAALTALGEPHGFTVVTSEDPNDLAESRLATVDVVVFLCTSGDILDPAQEDDLERWVRGGGGFVGIHSASDTEYDWPFYGELVGAWFQDHPDIQPGRLTVEDASHPAMRDLPSPWMRTDEWYNFRENPRGNVHVLATIDEASYTGGTMGDHPISWCHPLDAGRSFYTAGGHTSESYAEPAFRAHLAGAISWAAGRAPGDCTSD